MFDERFSKYLCSSDGNEEYLNGAWMVWQHQQSKVDELQRRNQMLNDSIKEQGQKLVYQNEVIETQAEKLLCLRDEKAEMQKRVDAVQALAERWKAYKGLDIKQIGLQNCANELEQALKGGGE